MEHDRNLLFGVLAVQLGKVTSGRLMQAAAAWAIDPTTPLDVRLVEQGALSQHDRDLIDRLVGEAVRAHAGDATATLDTFGGAAQVAKTFGGAVARTEHGPVAAGGDATVALAPPPTTGVLESPGRYALVSEQGRGGYGRVLLVHDRFMARDVALKELIPPSDAPVGSNVPTPSRETIEAVSRFLQEARITGQLEHPSIVPVYELGHRDDGALYYTMKLVRGQTLSKELSGRATLRERLELLPRYLDLCHAIAYAHDRGVIHRDIKPDNVMIGSFGETVVIDWGLAKLKGRADVYAAELKATAQALQQGPAASTAQTLYGTILGTPHFMAPEQARGNIDDVDERSDVYALGAVLYTLLTGKRPYERAPLQNVILHINLPPLVPVAKLAPDAPPELITICTKALETLQAERYQNAGELVREVQRFLSGALVQSHDYTLRDQVRRFVQRHKAEVVTVGAAAAALVTVAVVSYVQILQANRNERDQRLAAEQAQQVAVEKGRQEAEARALAERELYVSNIRLAYQNIEHRQFEVARALLAACPPAHRNWEWGYLEHACNRDLATLRGHAAPVRKAAVSRDGARAASGDASGAVILWDIASGKELRRTQALEGPVLALSFSADGRTLVTAGQAKEAVVRSVDTLDPLFSLVGHGAAINASAFGPDGRLLATASSDDTVRVWDVETRACVAVLSEHLNDAVAAAWTPDGTALITGSLDNTTIVWDTRTWKPALRVAVHSNDVTCIAVAPDGTRAASGGADGRVCVWELTKGTPLFTREFGADIRDVAFAPDGRRLAVALEGPVVELVSLDGGPDASFPIEGHSGPVSSAAFLPAGDRVLTSSEDASLKLWYAPKELAGPAPLPQGSPVQELHLVDPAFRYFAVGSTLGQCEVFDAQKGRTVSTFDDLGTTGLGGRLWGFTASGATMLYTGEDNRPKVANVTAGTRAELNLKNAPFNPGFPHREGTVAIASMAGEIEIYDTNSMARLRAFPVADPSSHILPTFSPDDSTIFIITLDKAKGRFALYETEAGNLRWEAVYPGIARDAAFADGRVFVSGSTGVMTCDAATGKDLSAEYDFPKLALGAIAAAPGGQRIVAELEDQRLIVLDGRSGRELLRIDRDTPNATAESLNHAGLFFSADGRELYAAASDCQGLHTWSAFTALDWTENGLSGGDALSLDEHFESIKRQTLDARLSQAAQRDAVYQWMTARIATIVAQAAPGRPSTPETDPFANAEVREWDISPSQWTMLLQMGRDRLKQLRDVHGYRGMKAASDLVLDRSLADFLSVLGFENNDIIVQINGSSTPGYDMFIEALETAQRQDQSEITCHFYRSGKPIIHVYHRVNRPPAASP